LSPIIFSQKEVEFVGLYASSRLRIIDGFRSRTTVETKKDRLISEIASLTAECRSVSNEIDSFITQIASLAKVPGELEKASKELSKTMRKTNHHY